MFIIFIVCITILFLVINLLMTCITAFFKSIAKNIFSMFVQQCDITDHMCSLWKFFLSAYKMFSCACSLYLISSAPNVDRFSSVAQSCLTLCNPMNCSTPGLPVHHQCPESTQTHVHRVGDAIQPSKILSSTSLPTPNPSQHQGLFQLVSSSHEVPKGLEFQLQHQSFQRTSRTDLL